MGVPKGKFCKFPRPFLLDCSQLPQKVGIVFPIDSLALSEGGQWILWVLHPRSGGHHLRALGMISCPHPFEWGGGGGGGCAAAPGFSAHSWHHIVFGVQQIFQGVLRTLIFFFLLGLLQHPRHVPPAPRCLHHLPKAVAPWATERKPSYGGHCHIDGDGDVPLNRVWFYGHPIGTGYLNRPNWLLAGYSGL